MNKVTAAELVKLDHLFTNHQQVDNITRNMSASPPVVHVLATPEEALNFFLNPESIGEIFSFDGQGSQRWSATRYDWLPETVFAPRGRTAARFGSKGTRTEVVIKPTSPGKTLPSPCVLVLDQDIRPSDADVEESEEISDDHMAFVYVHLGAGHITVDNAEVSSEDIYHCQSTHGETVSAEVENRVGGDSVADEVDITMLRSCLRWLNSWPWLGDGPEVTVHFGDWTTGLFGWTIADLVQAERMPIDTINVEPEDANTNWSGKWQGHWWPATFAGTDSQGSTVLTLGAARLYITVNAEPEGGPPLPENEDFELSNYASGGSVPEFQRIVQEAGDEMLTQTLTLMRGTPNDGSYVYGHTPRILSVTPMGILRPRGNGSENHSTDWSRVTPYRMNLSVQTLIGSIEELNSVIGSVAG